MYSAMPAELRMAVTAQNSTSMMTVELPMEVAKTFVMLS